MGRGYLRKALACVLFVLSQQAYATSDADRLLTLTEDKIDIGIEALRLAKEFYPNMDIAAYSKQIDQLADEAKVLANGTADPERRIRVLNTVLFLRHGFHYDREPTARSKQENYFLNTVLDTKHGICYTLPLLYIAVAQRLGYPIYPVQAPDHMFVRYVDPAFKENNIETTSGGRYFTDEHYIQDFSVSIKGMMSGSYMRTQTYREFLGDILNASSFILARTDGEKASNNSEISIKLNPKFADYYDNQRTAYLTWSKFVKGKLAAEYLKKAKQYGLKAEELGYVSPETIELGRKTRGLR